MLLDLELVLKPVMLLMLDKLDLLLNRHKQLLLLQPVLKLLSQLLTILVVLQLDMGIDLDQELKLQKRLLNLGIELLVLLMEGMLLVLDQELIHVLKKEKLGTMLLVLLIGRQNKQ